MPDKIPLFISHLHQDKTLVGLVHRLIDNVFSRVFDVFNTSGNPPEAGKKWRDEIRNSLDRAKVVLVILTPESAQRDWVLFESGAAWLAAENQEKRLIPCIYDLERFPSPLSEFQGINLSRRDSIMELIETLMTVSGLTPPENNIAENVNEYFAKLAEIKPVQSTNTISESNLIQVDVEKLFDIMIKFFGSDTEAMRFARVLKSHSILDKSAQEAFLQRLLDKKF
ncbi:MAG: toll/interleukin-1 receptor domain-containing protein [Chloroflexi bacterium]|nr:toll/interleukin-1 receptor domain-containing protein [Chloroflexota bacterium]